MQRYQRIAEAMMLAEEGHTPRDVKTVSRGSCYDVERMRIDLYTYRSILRLVRNGWSVNKATNLHNVNRWWFADRLRYDIEAKRLGLMDEKVCKALSRKSHKPRIRRGPNWKVESESTYQRIMDSATEIQSRMTN
jgi:hypothetical protein